MPVYLPELESCEPVLRRCAIKYLPSAVSTSVLSIIR